MMKFNQFGAMTALVAGFAFVGCSTGTDQDPGQAQGKGESTVKYNLLAPPGVVITAVSYDLNTAGGTDVLAGVIPVPNDNSVINGTLDALLAGDYSLDLSATGTYLGEAVTCEAAAATFSLTANQNLVLPTPINLVCQITVTTPDDSSRVTFNATVTVEQTTVVRRIVESFGIAPISVIGAPGVGGCAYPPMGITVANVNPAVTYSWSASPDGAFAMNAAQTSGTYTCQSDGTKQITVTAALAGATASRTVPVTCASTCDNPCGNGTVDPGEECDNAEPYCVACQIIPVCGDTLVQEDEICDPPGSAVTGGTCGANCRTIVPPTVTCGDGVVAGAEVCDPPGSAGPNGSTCAADCLSYIPRPVVCGDGIVEGAEVCDPPGSVVAGGTCNATCSGIIAASRWSTCEPCVRGDAALGPVQVEFCDSSPLCEPVEECVINSGCFNPVPGFCYCGGSDIDACEAPAYDPTGPCEDSIRAGAGTDSPNNAAVLERFFAFEYPLGVAMSLVNETNVAGSACQSSCFAP